MAPTPITNASDQRLAFSQRDGWFLACGLLVLVVFDRVITSTFIGLPWTYVILGLFYIPKVLTSFGLKKYPVLAFATFALLCCIGLGIVMVMERNSEFITPKGFWIGLPMTFLPIPMISFLVDLFSARTPAPWLLIVRSLGEIFVAFPIWLYVSFIIGAEFAFWWI